MNSRVVMSKDIFATSGLNYQETENHLQRIDDAFDVMTELLQEARQCISKSIFIAAESMYDCFAEGGKVMVCGNGGSAADAQHFAAELVGKFKDPERRGLPVMALTADSATLTAWSNDVGYDDIFARQVQAFACPGDIVLGISTTGRSRNLIRAFEMAREEKVACIALLGGDGGDTLSLADVAIVVPASDSQRVQEVHMLVLHLLCELVEDRLTCADRSPQREPIHSSNGNAISG